MGETNPQHMTACTETVWDHGGRKENLVINIKLLHGNGPTIDDWIKIWSKWSEYVKTVRLDFI